MKQKIRLEQKQIVSQSLDYIDMQSICLGTEGVAKNLIEKHEGNLNEIEKEIFEMEIPMISNIEGFNFREELLWNVKWLLHTVPGLLI